MLVLFIAVITASAQSSLDKDIAKAAAIENSVQRLAAYDNAAKLHGLAPHTDVKASQDGNWSISTDTSPIDDTKTVVCRLEADSSVHVGYDTVRPTLIIRFKEGELEAYINYGIFLGTESIPVTMRFGRGEAIQSTWSISTDNEATFITGNISAFLQRLEREDSFIVRLTPYGESPITVSFSLQGIQRVKEAIRDAHQ